ncbi:MAG: ATP-binding protein [Pseudomonadota bacterium]
MVTAWLVASAACAFAAALVVRIDLTERARRTADAAARTAEADAALAAATLSRSAVGALALRAEGAPITVGLIPPALAGAADGTGPLAAPLNALTDGTPFTQPIDGALEATGTYVNGAPTVFIAPRGAGIGDGRHAKHLAALLATAPHPTWVEDGKRARLWWNEAYAKTAGGDHSLLDANARGTFPTANGPNHARVATVVDGARKVLDVATHREDGILAALAMDITDVAATLTAKERALQSHAATLDHLTAAIAIFGPDRRLAFHNAAFADLWSLPQNFLMSAPEEETVLDRLRSERKLPETADFRGWKRDQLKGYATREQFERWWHLPDGQTLRVIANPGADGGVTIIYENVTEQLALERRYNALSRTQSETIDNLGEGVASFGPDGLLRLSNPAFWAHTGATKAPLGTHVRDIAATAPAETSGAWSVLAAQVTGLTDHRTAAKGRTERLDGHVLDYAVNPLPDGSTLATVADVTDSVNVARALVERNSALEAADKLKNAFIEHISYELRSPLNTIIGFTQLLTRPDTGPLTDRQRDYAHYISSSSEALLTIIDGILDLATIDAGIMELSIAPVRLKASLDEVLAGLKDRIAEAAIGVEVSIDEAAGEFEGDPQRVRQVLFNLASNAVSHSPDGGLVTIRAWRDGRFVALSIRDRGPGISPDKAEAVFDRFMTNTAKGRRGGVGLGLSLVKSFVELHGGSVAALPVDGPGAEVVVRFPRHAERHGDDSRQAA